MSTSTVSNNLSNTSQTNLDAITATTVASIAKTNLPSWSSDTNNTSSYDYIDSNFSLKEAEQAIRNLLMRLADLNTNDAAVKTADNATLTALTLSSFEKVSMNDLQLLMANISLTTFSNTADTAIKASELRTEIQKFLSDKKVQDYQDQLEKNQELNDKAKKGQVITFCFDWAVAAAEVAYGIGKLATAAATGDALGMAAGAAYLTAGVAGAVKAGAEMALYYGVGDEDMLNEMIDVAGKIQLGAEIAGAALDIMQVGKGIAAIKSAQTGATATIEAAAPQITQQIAAAGSKEAATAATKVIVEQTAAQVTSQLTQNIVNTTVKTAVETAVQKAIAETVQHAIQQTVQITAQELSKQITKEVMKQAAKAVVSAALFEMGKIATIRAASTGGNQIAQNAIKLETNEISNQISELIEDQKWCQFIYDWFQTLKEQQTEAMKTAIEQSSSATEGASQAISDSGSLNARIASAIVA
ncbi:type III secretion system translocon subunit SctE [uncultured Shewanella sp.]|uniref:type III secretion system translocon subunit SctE n=1 Tax=uncultured Shewanella sp. TaxID=173975 RepID=UPI0026163991|nr:type III secretion system translocon subunit SctE [uncultured Shewanella sp.]